MTNSNQGTNRNIIVTYQAKNLFYLLKRALGRPNSNLNIF